MTNTELYIQIGTNLKTVRKSKKITIERLAKLLGRSRDFILDAERGRFRISLDKLYEYCEVLDIELKSIIPDRLSTTKNEVIDEINKRNLETYKFN